MKILVAFRLAGLALATNLFLLCSTKAGLFRATGPLQAARESHTATLLANGKVLVAGGYFTNELASAELYDPATGIWTQTGALNTARKSHTATLLPNGKVLVVGGDHQVAGVWGTTASTELYDPGSGTWTVTGSLNIARWGHTATLLPTGKVLVAGGEYYDRTNSLSIDRTELYDPATGTWAFTGSMFGARYNHTASLLRNGQVLVAAGANDDAGPLNLAELYDPATGTWATTGALSDRRYGHTATLLPSGLVLVTGGGQPNPFTGAIPLSSSELYDPATGTWRPTKDLIAPRSFHTATLLPNGRVLVAAGAGAFLAFGIASAEEYDPATQEWASTGDLTTDRYIHTATLLLTGKVLVAGGDDTLNAVSQAELYEPAAGGRWTPTGPLATTRVNHTTTVLTNGQVLVTGGSYGFGSLRDAERYDPVARSWLPAGNMNSPRAYHTATLLQNGLLLAAGGSDGTNDLDTADLYDPAAGNWTPAGWLNETRAQHTATLLQEGQVLVAGGFNGALVSSAELYDPATGAWSWTGELNTARNHHTATLLPDGRVLIVGGYHFDGSQYVAVVDAELYDPATGAWALTHSMATARMDHTATLLPNGKVLVVGGRVDLTSSLSSAELYDPATGTWTMIGAMASARYGHTATLLTNGLILVAGGYNSTPGFLSSAELHDPAHGVWTAVPSMTTMRSGHTANLLSTGQVLAVGGEDFTTTAYWTSAELYDPASEGGPVPQPPILMGAKILANGSLQFTFTNTPGAVFSVLSTTLPTLPASEWLVQDGVTEISPGDFQFTDSQATNFPQRYYRVRSP